MLGVPVRQFLVGHDGVCRATAADGSADGVGCAGGTVRTFDNAGVGFGKIFNAFARAGGKNGRGNADERDAVQMFFHGINSVSKGRLKLFFRRPMLESADFNTKKPFIGAAVI